MGYKILTSKQAYLDRPPLSQPSTRSMCPSRHCASICRNRSNVEAIHPGMCGESLSSRCRMPFLPWNCSGSSTSPSLISSAHMASACGDRQISGERCGSQDPATEESDCTNPGRWVKRHRTASINIVAFLRLGWASALASA